MSVEKDDNHSASRLISKRKLESQIADENNKDLLFIDAKLLYQDSLPDSSIDCIPIPDAVDNFQIILKTSFDTVTLKNKRQRTKRLQHFYNKLNSGEKLTMFCHDMKGNYLPEDLSTKHALDLNNPNPGYPFLFSPINYTDIFIYFSHHGITIPPKRWINEAHNHGKLALGTLLFEENSNMKISSIIENIEKSTEKLAELLDHKYFDGYLINVEVKVDPIDIELLKSFLLQLKFAIRKRIGHDAPVIWYDAVCHDGSLNWQNQINEKNYEFYDICGFALINYGWKEEELKNTSKFAKNATNSIFFGIDMFGRNTFYDAGIDGCADALKWIGEHNYSAGIFAPGHCRECILAPQDDGLENLYNYWAPIMKYLTADPIPFTNPIKLGSPYKVYEKCDHKMFITYDKFHRYSLFQEGESQPFAAGCKLIFPKVGKYKLLSITVEKPTSFKVSASCNNGLVIFKSEKENLKTFANNDSNQETLNVHKLLNIEFQALEANAILNFVHIF